MIESSSRWFDSGLDCSVVRNGNIETVLYMDDLMTKYRHVGREVPELCAECAKKYGYGRYPTTGVFA